MGANIARRLHDQRFRVAAVLDARRDVATELARELGADNAESLSDVTERADIVITVVTDDEAMRAIYSEAGDSVLNGAGGKLFINCATVTPDVHIEVERLVESHGGRSLEACMASSITQAREGT